GRPLEPTRRPRRSEATRFRSRSLPQPRPRRTRARPRSRATGAACSSARGSQPTSSAEYRRVPRLPKSALGALGPEGFRVPASGDDEADAVPVEAEVVEARGRAAVRIVLAVNRLGRDDVSADAEQPELVAVPRKRDPPASRGRPEDDEADVSRRPPARDCDGDVPPAVAREVEADHLIGARGIDAGHAVA